jgi:hypothetical protein
VPRVLNKLLSYSRKRYTLDIFHNTAGAQVGQPGTGTGTRSCERSNHRSQSGSWEAI